MTKNSLCREEAIDLELLTDAILSHWKPLKEMNFDTILLDKNNIYQAQNEGGYNYYY